MPLLQTPSGMNKMMEESSKDPNHKEFAQPRPWGTRRHKLNIGHTTSSSLLMRGAAAVSAKKEARFRLLYPVSGCDSWYAFAADCESFSPDFND